MLQGPICVHLVRYSLLLGSVDGTAPAYALSSEETVDWVLHQTVTVDAPK